MYANMPRSENESSAITQIALAQPEISWRRKRSLRTVMSSQNQTTKTNIAKTSTRKLRKVKPSAKKSIAILLIHLDGPICGRREQLAPFLLLATLVQSLQGELECVAAGSAAYACLHRLYFQSGDPREIEPNAAWRERGGRLRYALSASPAFAYDQFPCSRASMQRRIPACAVRDVLRRRESSRLSAFPCRALRGASRGQGAFLVAHVTPALAQRLEVIQPAVIKFAMVTARS